MLVRERWKQFIRLFRPRMDTLVGVDFGNGAVKVAEVSLVDCSPFLRSLGIVEIPAAAGAEGETAVAEDSGAELDVELLTSSLQRALALSGVKAKDAVLAVGGKMVFVREVAFPRLPADELNEAIKWEIPKYVPYEADSYEYDYVITGEDAQTGDLRLLIVAAPKLMVRQLTQVVRNAGLRPVAVDIEPVAIYRTMSGAANSLVMDIGAASTQMSLFQNGHPVFTRIVPVAGTCLAEALAQAAAAEQEAAAGLDGYMEELGLEVQRTLQFLNVQNNRIMIEKIFVTGFCNPDSLVRHLQLKTELPVVGHNPLAGIKINPSLSIGHLKKIGPQLAVVIGLALRGDEP